MSDLPFTPYIVTALGRDGSSWLGGLIQDHPTVKVRWDGELLMMDGSIKPTSGIKAAVILDEKTYNKNNSCVASGLKLTPWMLWRPPKDRFPVASGVVDYLRALTPTLRVIHLERRNYLRSYVSRKVAGETGIWQIRSKEKSHYRRPQVKITRQELLNRVRYRKDSYANLRKLFANHPSLSVTYEDLRQGRDKTLRGVYQFLGLDSGSLPENALQKQEYRSLRESISDYDQLKKSFIGSPLLAMFD